MHSINEVTGKGLLWTLNIFVAIIGFFLVAQFNKFDDMNQMQITSNEVIARVLTVQSNIIDDVTSNKTKLEQPRFTKEDFEQGMRVIEYRLEKIEQKVQ